MATSPTLLATLLDLPIPLSADDGRIEADVAADAEETTYEAITDGQTDVATTLDGERMRVEAVGRMPMQKVYLWTSSKEEKAKKTSSNVAYDKAVDAPTDEPQTMLPTLEELTPSPAAKQYLEVGLVIGEDPRKYLPTGEARDKTRAKAREDRGVLDRDPSAIRAFIPISDYIATQAKYYVGTHPVDGRCFPRVIDQGVVFFYEEFWHDLPEHNNKSMRRNHVSNTAKWFAAIHKTPSLLPTAAIVSSESENRTDSNPLVVTSPENIVNMLPIQYTQVGAILDDHTLLAISKLIEDAEPNKKIGSLTATEGVKAFHSYEDEYFSNEDAEKVKRELSSIAPSLEIELIMSVREILVRKQWGGRLLYSHVALFLDLCQCRLKANDNSDVKQSTVDAILQFIPVFEKYKLDRKTSNDELVRKEKYRVALEDVKDYIRAFVSYNRAAAQALTDQHGPLPQHALRPASSSSATSDPMETLSDSLNSIEKLGQSLEKLLLDR